MERRDETIHAAVVTATNGLRRAFAERDPAMVAAQAIRAIALAVSTSRSYSACVAATTAAEFQALRCVEESRRPDFVSDPYPRLHRRNVVEVAFDAVRASDATVYDEPYGWPWVDDDQVHSSASSTQQTSSTSSSSGPPS